MIIKRLVLDNFISHEHTEIHFTQGVNVILGHNGAGKSSIIEAIKLVLMDRYRGRYIQDLVKRGKKKSSVEMEFSLGGKDYTILRTINIGKASQKGDALLRCGDEVIAQTIKGVSDAMAEILHIRKDVVMNSVFVEQGQIDSLISSERAEREKTFSSILSLDTLSDCAASIKEMISSVSHDMEIIPYSQEMIDERTNRIHEYSEAISSLNQELDSIKSELANRTVNEDLLTVQRTQDEKERTRLTGISHAMEANKAQKKIMESEFQLKQEELRKLIEQQENLRSRLNAGVVEIERELEDYLSKAGKRELLAVSISSLEQDISAIDHNMKLLDGLRKSHDDYQRIDSELNDARKELYDLREAWFTHESAKKEIEKSEKSYQEIEKSIADLEARVRKNLHIPENRAIDIDAERSSAEAERSRIEVERRELSAREASVKTTQEEIMTNISYLQGKNQCPVCLQPLTPQHVNDLMNEYGENLRKQGNELSDIEKRKEELGFLDSAVQYRNRYLNSPDISQLIAQRPKLSEYREKVQKAMESIKATSADAERYQVLESLVKQLEDDRQRMLADSRKYDQISGFLQSHNRDDIMSRISRERNELKAIDNARDELLKHVSFASEAELRSILEQNRRDQRDMREYEGKAESIRNHINDLREKISKASTIIENESLEVKDLPNVEERISGIDSELKETRKMIMKLSGDKASHEATVKSHDETVNQLKHEVDDIQSGLLKKKRLQKQALLLRRMRECFDRDGIQKQIRKSATEFITNRLRDYISTFGLRFDDVVVGDDMDITVQVDGSTEPLQMLSGGERTAISIGLRLALARYLSDNINTIIMDEPTNFLDEDRRNSLKDIIQNAFMTERIVPQMIIVTHHSELAAASDSTFTVSKVNGISVVETE